MPANLAAVPELPRDEAFAITADFKADTHPKKVSLGAGVYRDENSKPWILPSVNAAKEILHNTPYLDHEYLPIPGFEPFLVVARNLVLGQHDTKSTVTSIQTISGTGANHLGAAFLSKSLNPHHVFISNPTWGNHHHIWEVAGPGITQKLYPYYKSIDGSFDFHGMMSTLESGAVEGDVVILHACAHNPTGIDPTRKQWEELAQLFKRKKLFAFFDSAYQGFATGDVDFDAWAIRHFQQVLFDADDAFAGPQGMCVAQSFAKNFGLYGERVGAFHLILPSHISPAGPQSQLHRLVRAEISNCPLFGCRIVHTVLSNPELRAMWQQDLKTMSSRIKGMRSLLRQHIEKHQGVGSWSHLESQIGMFSFTGLSPEQVSRLRDVHHIYLMQNGRASLSGVNDGNVEYIADAFSEVILHKAEPS
ncbi:hypothetical protein S7711_08417 [Stachybotrys chartarum IBT 7711]|uniref:Aspartate aminotransferase n=1 Tax=Stachybotrys chartarum (strain CBS 109288 / IBT 7711) TaxID=1280523 RepID=A0A084BAS1_STACB|nr:hypothetical protein S7711_08417 [Stachybotrys chartarum IBT 7711]